MITHVNSAPTAGSTFNRTGEITLAGDQEPCVAVSIRGGPTVTRPIHSFVDRNGRSGRVLGRAMLLASGVTVPVSAGLPGDTDIYFAALTWYRAGDAAEIVRLMAETSFTAIANGCRLVADLREIRTRWGAVIKACSDSVAWMLVDVLLRQPVVDADTVMRALGVTPANAHRAIRHMADAGVITALELTGPGLAQTSPGKPSLSATMLASHGATEGPL